MLKTVEEYINLIEENDFSDEALAKILNNIDGKRKFLESIYTSGAKYRFSETFRDAAYNEVRRINTISSAIKEYNRRKQNNYNRRVYEK